MLTPELVDYIRQMKAAHNSRDAITKTLLGQGWDHADIDLAFVEADARGPVTETPSPAASDASAAMSVGDGNLLTASAAPASDATRGGGGATIPPISLPSQNAPMPSAAAMVKESLGLLRRTWWKVLLITIIGFLPIVPGLLLFTAGTILSAGLLAAVLFPLLMLLLVLAQVWAQGASMVVALENGSPSIGAALKRSGSLIFALVWIAVLQMMFAFSGMLLLLVGQVVFSVWFAFAAFIVLEGDARGMTALMRSREYVRGRWWMTAGYILLLGGVILLANMVLTGIPTLLGASEEFVGLFSFVFSMLVMLFSVAYMTTLYRHLKRTSRDLGEFPKPGQRGKYWLLAALGPIALLVLGLVVMPLVSSFVGNVAPMLPSESVFDASSMEQE